ncbi:MAG: HPr(Ser) kinase/phosphatase [Deltaproteobacteria bacterium]|nr:HPr(Ser) kinase/phosphatase [Deltaproteobacteria bacterium]MDQ3296160.1 HPr(Ser) kinase/phosphatase [Myxococcota bacterium]
MVPITVGELLGRVELGVSAVAGAAGLGRNVNAPRIQKPGLALTGWPEQLHDGRVLVLGATEIEYLLDHAPARSLGIATMLASDPACVVVCRSLAPPAELVDAANHHGVPLLVSSLVTADFIENVTTWMSERLAPTTELHGVLLDVLGVGILVMGKSGIGKSETALDLVVRGHRFVADDVIHIRRLGRNLVGRSAGIIGHHMEIRGLGIINVKDLFGISAVRETKKVELVVELLEWADTTEYDRLGFDDRHDEILGVEVPSVRLPVRPGRNLATLIEVAARNQLVKHQGVHSARVFRDQLHLAMKQESARNDVDGTVE